MLKAECDVSAGQSNKSFFDNILLRAEFGVMCDVSAGQKRGLRLSLAFVMRHAVRWIWRCVSVKH